MSTRMLKTMRKPLATCLLVALVAPGMAFAETAKEKQLEARVAELERQVQLLLSTTQQQQTQISQAQTDVTAVKTVQAQQPAGATVPAGKQPIQVTTITPGAAPGTTVKIGGFIKADFLLTQTGDGQLADDATGRALYLPGQTRWPVPAAAASVRRGLQRPRQARASTWASTTSRTRATSPVRSSRWTSSATRWATRPPPIPTA